MAKIKKTDGDSGVDTESFFDIVNIVDTNQPNGSLYDSISDDEVDRDGKRRELSKGMLQSILRDTQEVIGDFGNSLRDDTTTIGSKMNNLQMLEEVALAESVKAFSNDTIDEERLRASSLLLRIAQTIKGTINQKHRLQLQEDIDFLNPKISKAMSFFIEVFIQTIQESGVDDETTLKVLEALEIKTFQYSDIMQTIFKGVALSEVQHIQNPFLSGSQNYEEIDYIDIYSEPTEPKPAEDITDIKVKAYRSKLQKDKSLSKSQIAIKVSKYRKGLSK